MWGKFPNYFSFRWVLGFPTCWKIRLFHLFESSFIIFWIFHSPQPCKLSTWWETLLFASMILSLSKSVSLESPSKEGKLQFSVNTFRLSSLLCAKYLSFFLHHLGGWGKQVWLIALSNSSVKDGIDRAINTSEIIVLKNTGFS